MSSQPHLRSPTYERGLVEVADGVFAYLQPDGTWGWSNAGLVVGDGESALVDTLFDLHLTQAMLDDMASQTSAHPIRNVVNTHANGDHCYGNQLVAGPGIDVISSAGAYQEMHEVPASVLAMMMDAITEGTLGEYIQEIFGPFDFHGIDPAEVTVDFTGHHHLDAGGTGVELYEVGPAHTEGDVIAWLPEERVVFAGDILFIHGTPIMWAGPVAGWIAAIDRILELDPAVIVPGHGPLADRTDVVALRDYWTLVRRLAGECHANGLSMLDTVHEVDRVIDDSPYSEWTDRERIVVNVQTMWRELEPGFEPADVIATFQMMADNFVARRDAP